MQCVRVLLVSLAAVAACTRPKAKEGSTDVVDAGAVDATVVDPAGADADAGPPTRPEGLLGSSCRDIETRAGDPHETLCTAGRVAGLYAPVDTLWPGNGFRVLFREQDGPGARVAGLEVALRGDVVVVRRTTCGNCRRIMGWAFAGNLSKMSDADLRTLACRTRGQADGGLDLRTARGWEALLAAGPPAQVASDPQSVIGPYL